MNKLEIAVSECVEKDRTKLAATTFIKMQEYYKQLLRLARQHDITEPCQKLVDLFIEDDNDSKERKAMHISVLKRLDALCNDHWRFKDGAPLNETPFPSLYETNDFFKNTTFPIKKQIPVNYLIVLCAEKMKYINHTQSTTGQYWHAWNIFKNFCEIRNNGMYSDEISIKFLEENESNFASGKIKEWKRKINRKAVLILHDIAKTGNYVWHEHHERKLEFSTNLEEVRQRYLKEVQSSNVSKKYIYLQDYAFRNFIVFSGAKTKEDLSKLTSDNVLESMEKFSKICKEDSMSTLIPLVRRILKFLATEGFITHNYSDIIFSGNHIRGNATPYINKEDEKKLLIQLKYESYRNQAIMLLSLRLGLRESDICNLKFENIDFDNNQINIIQIKTKEPLVLPLLNEVKEAILNYIDKKRPNDIESPYVFLRSQAPYKKLTSIYNIVSKIQKKAGIQSENRQVYGSHLGRYTLVHRLLEIKVPHQVITDTLGHTAKESDKPYLSMEESILKKCALDCSEIGIITWKAAI